MSYNIEVDNYVSSRHQKYLRKMSQHNEEQDLGERSFESDSGAEAAQEQVLSRTSPLKLRSRVIPVRQNQ